LKHKQQEIIHQQTTTMSTSTLKPLDLFTYKELTPLPTDRNPNHHDLLTIQKQLNANAMTVESHGGSGTHGLLTLVVDEATHLAITQHQFVKPTRPPQTPSIWEFSTPAGVAITLQRHATLLREWTNYNNTKKEIRKQLIDAIPRDLIEELSDPDSEFNNVTPLQIMQHLYTNYGKITPDMLRNNLDKLNEPWNPTEPINNLWKQVKECRDFAKKGKEEIPESQVI
jgi:hypothetical protein